MSVHPDRSNTQSSKPCHRHNHSKNTVVVPTAAKMEMRTNADALANGYVGKQAEDECSRLNAVVRRTVESLLLNPNSSLSGDVRHAKERGMKWTYLPLWGYMWGPANTIASQDREAVEMVLDPSNRVLWKALDKGHCKIALTALPGGVTASDGHEMQEHYEGGLSGWTMRYLNLRWE